MTRSGGGVLALVVLVAIGGPAPRADAEEFAIAPDGFAVRMLDAEGNPEVRAGSHPDRLQIDVGFEGQSPDRMELEIPPGFGGNPDAVPECARLPDGEEECPPETQVGLFKLGPPGGSGLALPVYRLESGPDEIAAFGSKPGVEFHSTFAVDPSDFGITFGMVDLAESGLKEGRFELWGVPADHQGGAPTERRPFLTAPSTCGPLVFTLRARSGEEGASWLSALAETSPPQSGCESLAFDPRLQVRLSNPVADAPTGVSIELIEPEAPDESELANAQLKDVTVGLPPGMTISPAAIEGLVTCSDAELGLGDTGDASCPPASRVGRVELAAEVFDEPLLGSVYLGEERPGERFRLFVAVPAPGFVLKIAGAMNADPATGRLSATLSDLPQATISRILISLDGGPQSLLAAPLSCGPALATAGFVPWGGGVQVGSTVAIAIASRSPAQLCPGLPPFAPRFALGQSTNRAGSPSVVSTMLSRADGEPLPRRFSVALPAGLSAALGSVPACPEALAAELACPAAGRVGAVVAGMGPGDSPVRLAGDVYLTGPYKRAPLGLLFEVDARLGQFDLGTFGFRAAVDVNGRSGRVVVASDPIPEAVEGLQLRIRSIELSLDRPGLVRNPTSCRTTQADGVIEAATGAVVTTVSPFDVRDCRRLRFRPHLRLILKAPRARRGTHAALLVRVRMRPREAALRAMRISLPGIFRFDLSGLGAICSRPDARRGECPAESRIGGVAVLSPLVDGRLRGGAYLVDPGNEGQPDVWVSLKRAGIRVEMRGRMQIKRGHLVTRLSGLPDVPLTALTLRLGRAGGGILSLSRSPCVGASGARLASSVFAKGQNGARRKLRPPIATRLCRRARCHPCRRRAAHRRAGTGRR